MKFWKMNGAGNDFIIINNIEEKIPKEKLSGIAKRLCERHLSIGADGFMAVAPAEGDADIRMLFFNADGSAGEMCGNGARCICRYSVENGLAGETQRIETTAGLVTGQRITRRLYQIRLNDPTVCRLDEEVVINGEALRCDYIELGSPGLPHCVVEIKDLRHYPEEELATIGKQLRYWPGYPKGANVNFYDITDENTIDERTYERGVEDFTYACGTGTGATVMALTLKKRVSGKSVKVQVKGGELIVDLHMAAGQVQDILLTGPTNIVAKGEVCDEDLLL